MSQREPSPGLVPDPAEREPFKRGMHLAIVGLCLSLGAVATVVGFGWTPHGPDPGPAGLVMGLGALVFTALAIRYVIVLWLRGRPRLLRMHSDSDRCRVAAFAYGLSRTDLLYVGSMFSMWPLLTRRGARLWIRHTIALSPLMVAPMVLWGLGAMQFVARKDFHPDAAGPLGLLSIAAVGAGILVVSAQPMKRARDPAGQRISDVLFEVAARLAVHDENERLRWHVATERGNSHAVVSGRSGWSVEAKAGAASEVWTVTIGQQRQTLATGPISETDSHTLAASIVATLEETGVGDVWKATESRGSSHVGPRGFAPAEISVLGDLQQRFVATDSTLVDRRAHDKNVWTLATVSVGLAIVALLATQLLDVPPMWACAPLALLGATVAANVRLRNWPQRLRSTHVGRTHTVSLLDDELRIDTERVPLSRPFTATFSRDPGRGLHVDLVATGGQQRVRFTVQADCRDLDLPPLSTRSPLLPAGWVAERLWPELRARAQAQGVAWPYDLTR